MMRGTKGTLGSMKEGTKSKARSTGRMTAGKGGAVSAKASGHSASSHGLPASRKTSARKSTSK